MVVLIMFAGLDYCVGVLLWLDVLLVFAGCWLFVCIGCWLCFMCLLLALRVGLHVSASCGSSCFGIGLWSVLGQLLVLFGCYVCLDLGVFCCSRWFAVSLLGFCWVNLVVVLIVFMGLCCCW